MIATMSSRAARISSSGALVDAPLAQICKETGEHCREVRCRRRRDIDLPCWGEGCVGAVAVGDRDGVFGAGVLELAHRADEPIERLFGAGAGGQWPQTDLSHRRALPSLMKAVGLPSRTYPSIASDTKLTDMKRPATRGSSSSSAGVTAIAALSIAP